MDLVFCFSSCVDLGGLHGNPGVSDGPMFQGLPMFPGEVPATREVMVVKEAPSFADALVVRESVDADTLRHPGKDESEQTLENMKWIEEYNIAFKTNCTRTAWSMHFGGRNRRRQKRPWTKTMSFMACGITFVKQ